MKLVLSFCTELDMFKLYLKTEHAYLCRFTFASGDFFHLCVLICVWLSLVLAVKSKSPSQCNVTSSFIATLQFSEVFSGHRLNVRTF